MSAADPLLDRIQRLRAFPSPVCPVFAYHHDSMTSPVPWPCSLIVSATVGLVAAGCGTEHFSCTDASECRDGARFGTCQPNGACSFDDESCPSGQRYGRYSSAELADQCVPPADAGDGSTSGVSEPDSTSTSAPDATTATTATTATSLTSTSGSSTTDDEGSGSEDSGDSDGGQIPACAVSFRDDFEGQALDPAWSSEIDPAMQLLFMGGRLVLTYAEQLSWSTLHSVEAFDLADADLVLELDHFTGMPYGTELNFGLVAAGASIRLTICCGAVLAQEVVDEEVVTYGYADWDEARYLRLRTQGGEVHYQTSHDGIEWATLAVEEYGLDLSGARIYIGAGTWEETSRPAVARIESVDLCVVR